MVVKGKVLTEVEIDIYDAFKVIAYDFGFGDLRGYFREDFVVLDAEDERNDLGVKGLFEPVYLNDKFHEEELVYKLISKDEETIKNYESLKQLITYTQRERRKTLESSTMSFERR